MRVVNEKKDLKLAFLEMMKYPIKEEAKIWSCCRDENMLKSVLYYLKTIISQD